MNRLIEFILALVIIAGWVIAKGFWQTLAAVFIWPYSIYLVVEYIMEYMKWVA